MDSEKDKGQFLNWFISRPHKTGFLVFLLMFGIVAYIVLQRYQSLKDNDHREMSNIIHVVYKNMDQSLKNSTTSALTLALTINDEGEPENFDSIGRKLVDSNAGIDAVQLVPNGVIKYVYPLKGNDAALNLDILNTPDLKGEARKAIDTRKMYFAGPFQLRQGGWGIVGRLPVYKKNKFWGFSAVIIRLETLIKASGINTIEDSKYYFQLSKKNPVTQKETFFLPVNEDFSEKYYESMTFPDSDWKLYIITKKKYSHLAQILPLSLLGALMVILFSILLTLLLKKPAELQLLIQRQAEKLLNSEIKYKTIFDQAAIGIAHIDSNSGQFIEVNEQLCHLLGYSQQEMKGRNFQSITHPDDLGKNLSDMKRLHQGESREISMEKRYLTKSGDVIWSTVIVTPLWDIDESPTSHIAIIEDISIKKQAENIIRESEARFKSLFDDSPIALWEEDFSEVKKYLAEMKLIGEKPKTVMGFLNDNPQVVQKCIASVKIIDVNNECLKLHGIDTKKDLLDAKLNTLLDTESTKSFVKQLIAITSGISMITMDTRITREDGTFSEINLRWSAMRGYEDTLERVIVSTEDITAQKESERIIFNSQRKIESLINTIDGIVWECDYNTYEFTFVNKKAEEISGYSQEEWLNGADFWGNTIHPDDREWTVGFCSMNSKEKKQYDFEYRMIAKNGSVLWIRDIVNVIYEGGIPVRLRGIMIDITKAKEIEKDLNDSLELVTEQNKRLHNFSYIVSHNLRSHTANIQSITNLVEHSDSEEERNELIQLLKTVSGSLNETMFHLNDLLNIHANITLVTEDLNLNQYIENTLNVLSEQIATKKAVVLNNIPQKASIKYNPAYLESILLNLVSNAIRYSHRDRNPVITINWLSESDNHILEISDNGIGIDLAKHGDKLFGMYKTFHGNSDARGIGLFITRNQIEALDGKIMVQSTLGEGTSFKIHF